MPLGKQVSRVRSETAGLTRMTGLERITQVCRSQRSLVSQQKTGSPLAGWLAGTFICLLSAVHLNFGTNIHWKKCKKDLERQEGGWKT